MRKIRWEEYNGARVFTFRWNWVTDVSWSTVIARMEQCVTIVNGITVYIGKISNTTFRAMHLDKNINPLMTYKERKMTAKFAHFWPLLNHNKSFDMTSNTMHRIWKPIKNTFLTTNSGSENVFPFERISRLWSVSCVHHEEKMKRKLKER